MHHRSVLLGCALGAAAGCGSDAVVETKGGKVTVAKDGKTVTIEGGSNAGREFQGARRFPERGTTSKD
jgi:hypothetical protein